MLKDKFPRIFSYVLNDNLSAAQVFGIEDISTLLFLPLSVSAYDELVEMQSLMVANPLVD
jgi:hypothetical protein